MSQQGSNIEVSATVVRCFFRQFDGDGAGRGVVKPAKVQ
jgi:hypothetical protein